MGEPWGWLADQKQMSVVCHHEFTMQAPTSKAWSLPVASASKGSLAERVHSTLLANAPRMLTTACDGAEPVPDAMHMDAVCFG